MSIFLPAGLYIMTYHEISWAENHFLRGSCMVTPPDIFREHLKFYKSNGNVVSLSEGLQHLRNGTLTTPTFVITFDDGFKGVMRYGLPILREFSSDATLSLCPSFLLRKEFHWRLELFFIANAGGLHILRHKIRKMGYQNGSVKLWTNHHFSEEMRASIREIFNNQCPSHISEDAWRMFLVPEECFKLNGDGRLSFINHSMRHYYYGLLSPREVADDFHHSDTVLRNLFCEKYTGDLAIPFGGMRSLSQEAIEAYRKMCSNGVILWNNNVINLPNEYQPNSIGRIAADNLSVKKLWALLKRLSNQKQTKSISTWHA